MRICMPLLGLLLSNVLTLLFAQSCEDEILRFSDSGKIQVSSSLATIGESVIVTCSTKCAWNWHTVYIDGNIIDVGAGSVVENEDIRVTVEHEILNCPSCNEPDEIDCNDDSQGPLESLLNITLLQAGTHYVQCVAHLFRPDSSLWPENRVILIPSRAIRIDGIEDVSLAPSSTISSTSLFTSRSSTLTHSTLKQFATTSRSDISQHVTSEAITTLFHSSSANHDQFSTSDHSLATIDTRSKLSSQNPTSSLEPLATMIANQGAHQSGCELSVTNTAVFGVLGVLVVISLLLTIAVVVLICVNRRNLARYNRLCKNNLK